MLPLKGEDGLIAIDPDNDGRARGWHLAPACMRMDARPTRGTIVPASTSSCTSSAGRWPVVVNESLVQSYTGQILVAPAKLNCKDRFARLHTVGAFYVSGEIK